MDKVLAVLMLLAPQNLLADQLGYGDIRFTVSDGLDTIETRDVLITKGDDREDNYFITFINQKSGFSRSSKFVEEGGKEPDFFSFDTGYFCEKRVYLLTLRQSTPRYSGSVGYVYQTLIFLDETFVFLNSVPAPSTDITPLEDGIVREVPYDMPQRFLVTCTPESPAQPFTLSFIDRGDGP